MKDLPLRPTPLRGTRPPVKGPALVARPLLSAPDTDLFATLLPLLSPGSSVGSPLYMSLSLSPPPFTLMVATTTLLFFFSCLLTLSLVPR